MKKKSIILSILAIFLMISISLIPNITAKNKTTSEYQEKIESYELVTSEVKQKCNLYSYKFSETYENIGSRKNTIKAEPTIAPLRCPLLFLAYLGFLLFGSAEGALLIAFYAKSIGCLWAIT